MRGYDRWIKTEGRRERGIGKELQGRTDKAKAHLKFLMKIHYSSTFQNIYIYQCDLHDIPEL